MDALTLGQAVHRALEALLSLGRPETPRTVAEAASGPPVAVGRPDPAALAAAVREASARVAREEGLTLPGLERVLEERARPCLEAALPLLWPEGADPVRVLGLEASGSVALDDAGGDPHELPFRADLVEESGAGVRLTDFKPGRPLSTAKTEKTRRAHLLAAIGRGEALQAGAYARAVAGRPCAGRYVYLKPGLEEFARELAVAGEDPALEPALAAAAAAVLGSWHRGAFFPRLEEPDRPNEPRRCGYCEVRDACARGDSGVRRRLARWAAARREERGTLTGAEAALLDVWNLARRSGGDGEEGGA